MRKNGEKVIEQLSEMNNLSLSVETFGSFNKRIASNVCQHGKVSQVRLRELMHRSKFLIFFTNNDNLPNIVKEGLLSGCFVISNNVGGVPDMLSQNVGQLLPTTDILDASELSTMSRKWDTHLPQAIVNDSRLQYSNHTIAEKYIAIMRSN